MGENLESFEHWKSLFSILCHCDAGLQDPILGKELFFRLIPVIYEQLRQLPQDFFSDQLSKVSFIRESMNALAENVGDARVSKGIKDRMDKLKRMLE